MGIARNHVRGVVGVSLLLAAAGVAVGQSHSHKVFTQDNDEGGELGGIATAPTVGVGPDAVVVAANRRMALHDKAGAQVELRGGPAGLTSVFLPGGTDDAVSLPTMLHDPWAGWDPIGQRLWVVYSESEREPETPFLLPVAQQRVARLHMAVSKDPADFDPPAGPLDTLDVSHWWYYTEDTDPPRPVAGDWFDMTSNQFNPYKGEGEVVGEVHFAPETTLRIPSLAFDEQAVIVSVSQQPPDGDGPDMDATNFDLPGRYDYQQFYFIIPREHGEVEPLSILDGERPGEADITLLQALAEDELNPPTERVKDPSDFAVAVQEPYEQAENATLFISGVDRNTTVDDDGLVEKEKVQDKLRLRGFFDADPGPDADWTFRQRVEEDPVTGDLVLLDMDIPDELRFMNPTVNPIGQYLFPRTPDTVTGWRPSAVGMIFQSAVLVPDVHGNDRIFATHAVQPVEDAIVQPDGVEGLAPVPKWVAQWYVIDPDLANFDKSDPTLWRPTVVAAGRLPALDDAENPGDAYDPQIIVNRQGVAFIEYTYSDNSTWPEVRRVRLNNDYTAVVPNSRVVLQSGPPLPYEPTDTSRPRWSTYADAEADPFEECLPWSAHTLAALPLSPPQPAADRRDAWLLNKTFFGSNACFLIDLNADGLTDPADVTAFYDYYDRQARIVDVNADGKVTSDDMALYLHEYDRKTR